MNVNISLQCYVQFMVPYDLQLQVSRLAVEVLEQLFIYSNFSKMNIKEEVNKESCLLDICSQNEEEPCSKECLNKIKSEIVTSGHGCDIDIKTAAEGKAVDSNYCSEHDKEFLTKDFSKKVKNEAVKNDCEMNKKTVIEEAVVSNICSQSQRKFASEDPAILCNNVSKNNAFEPKVEITKEQCWVETNSTETLCSYNDIKHELDEDFYYIKSPSLCKDSDSSSISDLFSNEDLRNSISFNMTECSPEDASARKFQIQISDVKSVSPTETSMCSETPRGGKLINKALCLKQNNFLQDGKVNIQTLTLENSKSILRGEHIKAYKCLICQKSFKHSCNLKSHRLVHESKKANKCDVCEKDFKHLSSLKRHKLMHEGKKPHKCTICNKAFTQLSNCKTHKLIHEGIKPHHRKLHKCNICDKTFSRFYRLKAHKLIHEGIELHRCNICDKTFMDLSNLKRHKLSHEGIKPHKCKICEKTFTLLHHLKTHKLIHDSIKSHKCHICDSIFSDFTNLKRHKLIHEEKKPQ